MTNKNKPSEAELRMRREETQKIILHYLTTKHNRGRGGSKTKDNPKTKES